MRKEDAIPEKEGLLLSNGMVNEFFNWLHALSTDLQAVVTVAAIGFWKPSGHAMSEPSVFVATFPPLSALMAEITAFSEKLGQRVELVEIGNEFGPALVVESGTAFGVLG